MATDYEARGKASDAKHAAFIREFLPEADVKDGMARVNAAKLAEVLDLLSREE